MKLLVGRGPAKLPIHKGSSTKHVLWGLIQFLADGCLAEATKQAELG